MLPNLEGDPLHLIDSLGGFEGMGMPKKRHLKIASSSKTGTKSQSKKALAGTVEGLKILEADVYTLYLKTQNYHWNVTGPFFRALHELFDEQYHELADAVDTIAERIRALDEVAPATFADFIALKTIDEGKYDIDPMEMIEDLVESHFVICELMTAICELAEKDGDEATLNLLGDRLEIHEKTIWMLKAHLM